MSAETLRRAAALMRERAEAATPGPWESLDGGDRLIAPRMDPTGQFDDDFEYVVDEPMSSAENAEHVASWHPTVALAVADWLDNQADWLTCDECGASRDICIRARQKAPNVRSCCPDCSHGKSAMKVARAYVGEPA